MLSAMRSLGGIVDENTSCEAWLMGAAGGDIACKGVSGWLQIPERGEKEEGEERLALSGGCIVRLRDCE